MTAVPEQRPDNWGWAVCGASVARAAHQRHGVGCDDAYGYGMAGALVVAAVAKGAASTDSVHFAALLRGLTDDQNGDDTTRVLSALLWETDEYHPSARPTRTLIVGSPAPITAVPAHGGSARRQDGSNHG